MLNHQEAEKLIKQLPKNLDHEDRRASCSVVIGFRDGKSISEICRYYWLDPATAQKWWNYFNFSEFRPAEKRKRGVKMSKLDEFIKSNIGKTLKSSEIIELCEITTPTFYNYLNANRGYFKKIGRGNYLIIDPVLERKQDK
jgi:hypothetical protein